MLTWYCEVNLLLHCKYILRYSEKVKWQGRNEVRLDVVSSEICNYVGNMDYSTLAEIAELQ